MAHIPINDLSPRSGPYTATGGQTVFAYTFPIFDQTHLVVTRRRAGTLTTLVLTTDYTVSGVDAASGGNVTLVTGATADDIITIEREVPVARSTDFTTGGDFYAATVNEELDLMVMMMQQLERDIAKCLHIKDDDSSGTLELPLVASRASKYLAFDASGEPIASSAASGVPTTALWTAVLDDATLATSLASLGFSSDVQALLLTASDAAFRTELGLGTAAVAATGVASGNVPLVNQTVNATTRAATTTLGTSLNHTLSDSAATITAFNGVAGVTYHCRCLGAGAITHHATDLIVTQTGASIAATAAGDTFDVEMITATTCRLKNYQKADGTAMAGSTAPVFGRVVRTAGNVTTTSTSLVDLTGATVTFTTGAFPVAVGATQIASVTPAAQIGFNIMVDAALELGAKGYEAYFGFDNRQMTAAFAHQTAALSAAAHTIKEQWKVDSNTGTIHANTDIAHSFWAHEIR